MRDKKCARYDCPKTDKLVDTDFGWLCMEHFEETCRLVESFTRECVIDDAFAQPMLTGILQ